MHILVTGGAGFIGSHVAERFLAAGATVTVVDNLVTGRRSQVPSAASFHQLDIRSPETAALVRDGGFDVIAHLAAQIDVRASITDPAHDADVNVVGTLNLLEAAREARQDRPPRVIFASTGGALYGEVANPPSDELTPKNPDAPYGVGKLSAELYMASFGRVHGMECVALRFGNVYGPRQDPHGEAGVIAIFCGRLQVREPFVIFGDGSQTRDYIYVGDVAAAFLAAAGAPLAPAGPLDTRAFNIGTGVETSVLEVAEALQRASGRTTQVELAAERRGEVRRSVLDPGKAKRELGWAAQVALEEGLAATWSWIIGGERGET